jgi:spore germination protein YaaH
VNYASVLLALALLVGAVSGAQAAPPSAKMVLAYYVPYDATSWGSLQAHADAIDVVAGQWVSVDACGNLSSRDDETVKDFAHANGLRIVPSLFVASASADHQVLTNDSVIQQIVDYTQAEGYDGFDLDLEGVDPSDRQTLTEFVAALAAQLHAAGKMLTLALPAKVSDTTTGWAGAFDIGALGAQADLATIMAYEYRGPFSGPGSVAPYDWVQRVLAFTTQQMPSDRVLLGLAFYGYDWNTSTGSTRSVGYPQVAALADSVGAQLAFDSAQQSSTFTYVGIPPTLDTIRGVTGHTLAVHSAPPCDIAVPPSPPRPTPQPNSDTDAHEVWIEDSASAAARLGLARLYGTAGVSTWRLGQEDPTVWPLFAAYRGHT